MIAAAAVVALGSALAAKPFDIDSIQAQRFSTPEGVYAVMDPAIPYLDKAVGLYVGRSGEVKLSPELYANLQRDAPDVIGPILRDADARGTADGLVTPAELEATVNAMEAQAQQSGIASLALR